MKGAPICGEMHGDRCNMNTVGCVRTATKEGQNMIPHHVSILLDKHTSTKLALHVVYIGLAIRQANANHSCFDALAKKTQQKCCSRESEERGGVVCCGVVLR